MKQVTIRDRDIGPDAPCYIVAEIGANHNQDEATAKRLIDGCIEAGVDAVKFQSFTVENWVSREFTEFPTMKNASDLHGALRMAELSYELYSKLNAYCQSAGVACFSTPSHRHDVDALAALDAPAYKFGAVQITDLPTIAHAARLGKPVILSAGAADLSEVARAVETIWDVGNEQIVLLQCTSQYPCRDYGLINQRAMLSFMAMYDFPVGFSDHTLDPVLMPAAATALGARVIEKHVTLDRTMEGPDHPFALEPHEVKAMVKGIRNVERAMGSGHKRMLEEEKQLARLGRRSLVAARAISAGQVITDEDITIKRPGTGIEPAALCMVIGRTSRVDILADQVLTWEMV